MSSRWARFARGWLAASFSVFVGAFAHVAGGGHSPSALAVVLSLAFAGMVAVPLAGKTVSLLRLTISVGFAQAVFHTLFALGGGATVTQLGHHGPLAITGGAVHGHEGMLPAHVLAAAVTIVALRLGEGAFWMLLRLAREGLRRTLLPAADPVRIDASAAVTAVAAEPRRRVLAVQRGPLSRRGPPVFAV